MRTIREHWPLIKVAGAAVFSLVAAICLQAAQSGLFRLSGLNLLWFACGALYTHLFEYFYHKIGMHRLPDPRHLKHHQIFTGANFQSRNEADLKEIATEWYIFPQLFAVHYLVFLSLFPARFAPAFFLGVTCHFIVYEAGHWFTHLKDNAVDRVTTQIPLLGAIRKRQIEHHRLHHEIPLANFNFTPPYFGDRIAGTLSRAEPLGLRSKTQRS